MKILYIENIRLPTEKAHGIQIMKMCEAFADLGHEVVLFVPCRKNTIQTDPFEFYGIKKIFTIKRVWVPNIIFLGKIGFYIQTLYFSEVSAQFLYSYKPELVYSREERILVNLIFIAKNIIWESHRGSWNLAAKIISRFAKKMAVISRGLKDFYIGKKSELSRKIVLLPDGVDLFLFDISLSKEECRLKLHLPKDRRIALYAGHLYAWKGAHIFAEASKSFNGNEIAVFVGGTEKDLKAFREKYNQSNGYKNCMILGWKPYYLISLYLKAADVLVLPNSAHDTMGSIYTSPLKLFEYMASGTPIVTSNVPAIREILDESNSTIFTADSSEGLYRAIEDVFREVDKAEMKALNARKKVQEYSWISRAKTIAETLPIV